MQIQEGQRAVRVDDEAQGTIAFWKAGAIAHRTSAHAMPVSPEQPMNTRDSGHGGSAGMGGIASGFETSSATSFRAQHQAIESPEQDEDAEEQRGLRTPATPTPEELADHVANGHLPYRSWCPDCVEASGREWPHSHGEGRSIPTTFSSPLGDRKNEMSSVRKIKVTP